MEILSNIWNVLSTENDLFIDLIFIPLAFVEYFIMLNLFTSILKINHNRNQKIIFTIIFALTCIIAYYFIPAPYYTIIDYIIMSNALKSNSFE